MNKTADLLTVFQKVLNRTQPITNGLINRAATPFIQKQPVPPTIPISPPTIPISPPLAKSGMELKWRQHPTADQVTQMPTAVVVQGDQNLIKGNQYANKFYAELVAHIRSKGFAVQTVKGEAGTPPKANLWVGHGGLTPPKGTKVLNIPQYPTPFLTKSIISALDRLIEKQK